MKKKIFDYKKGFQGYDITHFGLSYDFSNYEKQILEKMDDTLKRWKHERLKEEYWIRKHIKGDWSAPLNEANKIAKHLLIEINEFLSLPINLINSFMNMKISGAAIVGKRKELLEYYIEMFNEIPSGSHMVRAYTYMEQIFLDKYNKSEITVDEKAIERFDKLKALALNNQNIHERKAAFIRSVKQFCKIAAMEDLKLLEEE